MEYVPGSPDQHSGTDSPSRDDPGPRARDDDRLIDARKGLAVKFSRSSVVLAVVGVLLLVAAGLVHFVYLPSASKLPSDFDTTQSYSGTYAGLNPAVLAGSSSARAVISNAPVTASRRYQTSSTQGDTATVTRTLQRSLAGQSQPSSQVKYAVDRTDFSGQPAPSGSSGVVSSQGQIFSLPLHPSTSGSYRLWDEATAKAYPLTYKGTTSAAGRDTHKYRSVAEGTLADPAALGLPTSISRPQLTALAPSLATLIPAALQAQLPRILAALPDTIPLTWTSSTDSTIYADTTTGAPIRVQSAQKISGGIAGISLPFATISLNTTSASESAIADDAAGNASNLTLVGTTIPVVLLVLGILVLVLAVVLAVRNARHPGGTAPARPAGEPTPAKV